MNEGKLFDLVAYTRFLVGILISFFISNNVLFSLVDINSFVSSPIPKPFSTKSVNKNGYQNVEFHSPDDIFDTVKCLVLKK